MKIEGLAAGQLFFNDWRYNDLHIDASTASCEILFDGAYWSQGELIHELRPGKLTISGWARINICTYEWVTKSETSGGALMLSEVSEFEFSGNCTLRGFATRAGLWTEICFVAPTHVSYEEVDDSDTPSAAASYS